MSPSELARRIAALDWSACSLQHQLAVSAAVLALGAPSEPVPARSPPSNITVLPVRPRTCWTTLCHLDGRPWASSSHFGPEGAWGWIVESVCAELGCFEEQVGCVEGSDNDDLVTVDGLPVYRIQHTARPGVN